MSRSGQPLERLTSALHPALRARIKRAKQFSAGPSRHPDYGLVSVVVPMYNVEQYVDRCLTSLVTQSYRRLEIILVDDGSTDSTARIVAGYTRYDRRIRLIRQSHTGNGRARNTGIQAAKGGLLAFADADDVVPARAYETMAASLAASGSDFCVGSYNRIRGSRRTPVHLAEQLHSRECPAIQLRQQPEIISDVFLWNKMFKRTFWDSSVAPIPEGIRYEDQETTARAYLRASSFDVLSDVVYWWRIREDGSSLTQQKHLTDDLQDRLAVTRTVAGLLQREAPENILGHWYRRLLGTDLVPYMEQVIDATDEYWQILSQGIAELAQTGRGYTDRIDPQARVLAYLAAEGRRADLARAVVDRINNGTASPLEPSDGMIMGRPPFLDLLQESVPQELLMVDPVDLELVAGAKPVEILDNGNVLVHGHAYVRNVDLRGTRAELGISSRGPAGRRVLDVHRFTDPHIDIESGDRNCSYADSAFAVELEGNDGAQLEVSLQWEGHRVEGTVRVPAMTVNGETGAEGPYVLSLSASGDAAVEVELSGTPDGAVYALVTARHRIPAEVTGLPGGRSRLVFRLPSIQWGRTLPAPPTDSYTLRWRAAGGEATAADPGLPVREDTAGRFRSFRLPAARIRAFRTPAGALAVNISAPLEDQETGTFHQYRMRRSVFGAGAQNSIQPGIFFESFEARNCADNPRAVSDYLASAGFDEPLYWSVADSTVEFPPYAVPLLRGSADWYEKLATVKRLVNNNNFPWFFRKAPGQFYLQTWHGTPLKRIGLDVPQRLLAPSYRDLMSREAKWWDLLLAQNDFAAAVLPAALGYSGKVLTAGSPRNDVLVNPGSQGEQIRARLGISGKQKVLLYAPTWRDEERDDAGRSGWVGHLDVALASRQLGPGYTFLIRGHHNVVAQRHIQTLHNVLDVSSYPNINDLYLAADALVTDYSSAMFDFCLLGKPMYFLVPDRAAFESSRGLYLGLADTVPGVPAATTAELVRLLRQDSAQLTSQVRGFSARFAGTEQGRAAQAAAETMLAAAPASIGAQPQRQR